MDRTLRFIAGGWVVAALGTLIANTGVEPDEEGGLNAWFITLVILAVVAIALYLILRGRPASDTTALVLAIIAAASFVVFWLGIGPIFAGAAAAFALPQGAEPGTPRSGKATAALALAALATLAFLVLVFVG